jgi:hypothetical protein
MTKIHLCLIHLENDLRETSQGLQYNLCNSCNNCMFENQTLNELLSETLIVFDLCINTEQITNSISVLGII